MLTTRRAATSELARLIAERLVREALAARSGDRAIIPQKPAPRGVAVRAKGG